jgi:short-subunit dehydrogenase
MNDFKSIIITGSSSGLGAEIAKQFTTKSKKNFYYPFSKFNDVNIRNYKDIEKYFSLIDTIPAALINNAAVCYQSNIIELENEKWNEMIETNINGIFYCSKLYIKLCMKNNFKGKIINIASTAGNSIRPGRACYSATKSFVINYSLSLAEEIKEYGIKVFCISPSAFDSKLRRQICPDDNFSKMITKEEIAKFIIDIIDDGKYLDSQNILIRS